VRLADATAAHLLASIHRPDYDRAAQASGIVHFGIGAFHRAHQAWYTDRAMERGDRDWAITGVSLRSASVAAKMNPQDGLFTVIERSGAGVSSRLVKAVRTVLVGDRDRPAIVARIAAPETKLISFTVTEKGYCRAPDGSLNPALAGRGSIFGFLAEGLSQRKAAGLPGVTLLACDNLADNGRQLERLTGDYCARHDPALGRWIAAECAFPNGMIDRIVPATTAADIADLQAILGLRDEAAVITEPFSQWVIEDRFAGARPRWEDVGVQIVEDVAPYETAKLRMLNGAHSALAYLGLAGGHEFVHQAIADAELRPMIERLMRDEAATSLTPAPEQDLSAYAEALIDRFANPVLNHRLIQIAMDGSQKIPQRWLETLDWHQQRGRDCPMLHRAVTAWLCHVRGDNGPVDDPLAATLAAVWISAGREGIVEAVFGPTGLLPCAWRPSSAEIAPAS
jgi:fructuronate reductase